MLMLSRVVKILITRQFRQLSNSHGTFRNDSKFTPKLNVFKPKHSGNKVSNQYRDKSWLVPEPVFTIRCVLLWFRIGHHYIGKNNIHGGSRSVCLFEVVQPRLLLLALPPLRPPFYNVIVVGNDLFISSLVGARTFESGERTWNREEIAARRTGLRKFEKVTDENDGDDDRSWNAGVPRRGLVFTEVERGTFPKSRQNVMRRRLSLCVKYLDIQNTQTLWNITFSACNIIAFRDTVLSLSNEGAPIAQINDLHFWQTTYINKDLNGVTCAWCLCTRLPLLGQNSENVFSRRVQYCYWSSARGI